jgi:hypothetical protein
VWHVRLVYDNRCTCVYVSSRNGGTGRVWSTRVCHPSSGVGGKKTEEIMLQTVRSVHCERIQLDLDDQHTISCNVKLGHYTLHNCTIVRVRSASTVPFSYDWLFLVLNLVPDYMCSCKLLIQYITVRTVHVKSRVVSLVPWVSFGVLPKRSCVLVKSKSVSEEVDSCQDRTEHVDEISISGEPEYECFCLKFWTLCDLFPIKN